MADAVTHLRTNQSTAVQVTFKEDGKNKTVTMANLNSKATDEGLWNLARLLLRLREQGADQTINAKVITKDLVYKA